MMKNINKQKNWILAVFFGGCGWVKEGPKWGLAVFVLAVLAFAFIDWLKAPLGDGPLDKLIGIRRG